MKYRFWALSVATVLALGLFVAAATTASIALAPGDVRPVTCDTGATYANSTLVCPTAASGPQSSATPTTAPTSGIGQWQPAGKYENGDAPPAWVTQWSQATFGHGLIYGGDEATPHEFEMKPFGFKGYAISKDGVQLYIRVHESSNPMDRAKRYHSYEIYARDATGAVSFWQGWMDRGDPATARFAVCNYGTLDKTLPQTGTPHGWVDDACGKETWYTRGQDWQWDIVDVINDATTIPQPGETADDMNPADWTATGKLGLSRMVYAYWYGDDAVRYPARNNPSPRGWFCATPTGDITGVERSPGLCAAGSLDQYISPTFKSVETAVGTTRLYSCPQCALPN